MHTLKKGSIPQCLSLDCMDWSNSLKRLLAKTFCSHVQPLLPFVLPIHSPHWEYRHRWCFYWPAHPALPSKCARLPGAKTFFIASNSSTFKNQVNQQEHPPNWNYWGGTKLKHQQKHPPISSFWPKRGGTKLKTKNTHLRRMKLVFSPCCPKRCMEKLWTVCFVLARDTCKK